MRFLWRNICEEDSVQLLCENISKARGKRICLVIIKLSYLRARCAFESHWNLSAFEFIGAFSISVKDLFIWLLAISKLLSDFCVNRLKASHLPSFSFSRLCFEHDEFLYRKQFSLSLTRFALWTRKQINFNWDECNINQGCFMQPHFPLLLVLLLQAETKVSLRIYGRQSIMIRRLQSF